MGISKDLTKEERITSEVRKLNRIFTGMNPEVKKAVHSLIENAAFMSITLEDLQKDINTKGPISEYQNGENQWGTKKSPEVEIYNTMVKNHATLMKQLTDLLPKPSTQTNEGGGGGDNFESFVASK